MIETEPTPPNTPPQPKPNARPYRKLKGTIRCAECGHDFKSDTAFAQHVCDKGFFNFDYAIGSNL